MVLHILTDTIFRLKCDVRIKITAKYKAMPPHPIGTLKSKPKALTISR